MLGPRGFLLRGAEISRRLGVGVAVWPGHVLDPQAGSEP